MVEIRVDNENNVSFVKAQGNIETIMLDAGLGLSRFCDEIANADPENFENAGDVLEDLILTFIALH